MAFGARTRGRRFSRQSTPAHGVRRTRPVAVPRPSSLCDLPPARAPRGHPPHRARPCGRVAARVRRHHLSRATRPVRGRARPAPLSPRPPRHPPPVRRRRHHAQCSRLCGRAAGPPHPGPRGHGAAAGGGRRRAVGARGAAAATRRRP
eukprot:635489-Prymnesium_polylepis.1